jgi:acyl-CoA thioesterase
MVTTQQVLEKMWQNDHFSQWLGLKIDQITEGGCRLHYTIRRDMLNGFGTVHGGIIFSAADSCFAFACNSHGRLAVALDVSITFTKAAKEVETLYVEAKEVHLGNKTSVYDIKTTNEKGEIVAIFKGTAYRTEKEI